MPVCLINNAKKLNVINLVLPGLKIVQFFIICYFVYVEYIWKFWKIQTLVANTWHANMKIYSMKNKIQICAAKK